MKLQPNRRVLGGLLLASSLLLAACGASGADETSSKDETTTTKADKTTTTKAETTTTEAEADADAQARADSVELTVSDFPDGWSASPSTTDDGPSPLEDCDPVFTDESTTLAKHSTDDFTIGSLDSGDGTNLAAETRVFDDEAAAKDALAPFSDEDVIACLDEKLKGVFGGNSGADVTGSMEEDDLDVGADQSEGVSATYTINASDGSTATVNVGLLLIRTGDLATMVTITSVGDSLDPTTLQAPISKIAELQADA